MSKLLAFPSVESFARWALTTLLVAFALSMLASWPLGTPLRLLPVNIVHIAGGLGFVMMVYGVLCASGKAAQTGLIAFLLALAAYNCLL